MERYLDQLRELADQLRRARAQGSNLVHDPRMLRVQCGRFLGATDEFLVSIGTHPDQREPLLWLKSALEDAAHGIENKLTAPNRPQNRTPIPRTIRELRGEVSAVIDFLMQHGRSRNESASYVLRRIDQPTLAALRHQGSLDDADWRTIDRWRQSATKEESDTPERTGFLRLKTRINRSEKTNSPDERASGLLKYIAGEVQSLRPTSD